MYLFTDSSSITLAPVCQNVLAIKKGGGGGIQQVKFAVMKLTFESRETANKQDK